MPRLCCDQLGRFVLNLSFLVASEVLISEGRKDGDSQTGETIGPVSAHNRNQYGDDEPALMDESSEDGKKKVPCALFQWHNLSHCHCPVSQRKRTAIF